MNRLRPIRVALAAILLVAATAATAADKVCAPDPMLKVVTALDIPGLAPGHFARVPKTLYRYGSKYGRVEEAYNPETKFHLLVVVDEPHVWMVNLADRSGRYLRDPGPTYYFRARIFSDAAVQSLFLRTLEVGCEASWLEAAGARSGALEHPKLGRVRALEYSEGEEHLALYEKSDRPLRLELSQRGKLVFAMDYLEHANGLKFDRRLFEKPAGIAISGDQ